SHGAGGVHAQQHQVGLPALEHGPPQVGGDEGQPGGSGRGGAQRGGTDRGGQVDRSRPPVRRNVADGAARRGDRPRTAAQRAVAGSGDREQPGTVRLLRGGDGHRRRNVGPGLGVGRGGSTGGVRGRGGSGARVGRDGGVRSVLRGGAASPARIVRTRIRVVAEHLVEQVLVHAGTVERVAPTSVRQGEAGGGAHI